MHPAFCSAEEIKQAITFEGLIAHLRESHRGPPPDLDRLLMTQKAASGLENSYLLLPAWTSRNSPDWSLPAVRRPNQAVRKTVGIAAATVELIPAGKGRTSDSPANAYSAYPPVPV